MLRRIPLLMLTLFAASAFIAAPAGAVAEISIDSFNVGTVSVNSNDVPNVQSALNGADVLSTNRTLLMSNSVEVSVNSGIHTGQLFYEADNDDTTASSFSATYNLLTIAPGGYDLTVASTYDRFLLDVITNTLMGDLQIKVTDIGDVSAMATFATGTGEKEILYCGAFCGVVDLEHVKEIMILGTTSGAADEVVQLGRLAIVPEPGTAGMLTLGLFGLAAASPRKRIAA